MSKILWAGAFKDGGGRFWGYFADPEDDKGKAAYWGRSQFYYYTFWGKRGGKVNFARTIGDRAFKKNCSEKRMKYFQFRDPVFEEMVLSEFGQMRLFKKLKNGI